VTGRTLVAGVGNVFLRDDAFGVEVVRLLDGQPRPPGVQIRDYGIRGVHLVYELLDGCDLFVLIDAAARGEEPGTVSVLEVDLPDPESLPQPVMDAHDLTPDAIFALLASLGGRRPVPGGGVRAGRRQRGDGPVRAGAKGPAARGAGGAGHPGPGKEVTGMLSRLIKAVLVAALLALVIDSLPDIKRYLEIREM